jgi:hypothetical protein
MSGEHDWKGPFIKLNAKVYHGHIIERHMNDAAGLLAATGEQPDNPAAWAQLLTYAPSATAEQIDDAAFHWGWSHRMIIAELLKRFHVVPRTATKSTS